MSRRPACVVCDANRVTDIQGELCPVCLVVARPPRTRDPYRQLLGERFDLDALAAEREGAYAR